jgi:ketopantoate reductase
MKIGVVGVGALGGYYGARLCRAGAEVHLLLRADYDVVREHGLRVLMLTVSLVPLGYVILFWWV